MISDNKTVFLSVKEWRCNTMHVKYYCIMQKALEGKLSCISAPACPEILNKK